MADDDLRVPADAGEHAPALARIAQRLIGPGGGIACGPGWYPLLAALDERLATIAPGYSLRDCKSKFAGLRYYANPNDPAAAAAFHAAIAEAEQESQRICEVCGAPGSLHDDLYWVKTLCQHHTHARMEEAYNHWRQRISAVETDWPPLTRARWGTGWADLLADLRRDLRRIDPQLFVSQVRERDGLLSVSWWPSDPALRAPIEQRLEQARSESGTVCERCSAPGQLRADPHAWESPYTLCAPCAALHSRTDHQLVSGALMVESLHRGVHMAAATTLVLIENVDGTLSKVAYPTREHVQAVERDGQLTWLTAANAVGTGTEPVGGPVPAVVLRRGETR